MSSTSLYTLVAGASVLLALWQPVDADPQAIREADVRERTSAPIDRASQRIDDRVARHKERWEQRKAQRRVAEAGP